MNTTLRLRFGPAHRAADATPTPSLRRRVLVTVVVSFVVLLVVVGVSVDIALGHQLRSDLSSRLSDRADRSRTLTDAGYTPQQLVSALQGNGIAVRVRTAEGTTYGSVPTLEDQPDPPSAPDGRAKPDVMGPPDRTGPPVGPGDHGPGDMTPGSHGRMAARAPTDSLILTRRLPDGSVLTLVGDTSAISEVRRALRLLMGGAGVVTVVVAAFALALAVRRALRPLDSMVAVARDITAGDRGRRVHPTDPGTELGRAAQSMDEMLDALERAESETKRFLADAAHELRTPIAGLSAVAEQLGRDGRSHPERIGRWTELMLAEARTAGRLVEELLDMARIDADPGLSIESADLVAVVGDAVERGRLRHPHTQIELRAPTRLPVDLDAGRIGQVLSNLIDNAARVCPPDQPIEVAVTAIDSVAQVTVTDAGPGVPVADRERIFDRLVRLEASRSTPGAGLGLSIARALVRAHGGDLRCVDHTPGARFVLTLPMKPG
ncbi:HAMP domain-containing sensor histidine kinase [Williamsia sp. CHRR-6]|uniref:HAMP domain-containing sensor histidine kinase n=1 Tax=Williamsia sp. CHRR-6 TaxID=2835871 RepID=UPI001BDB120C|nr:HAMP domain-containing sensor histidine kinase [Williamsia sp. CHRR-6]MBT0567283.1 HAMP domain-containing histidine kinase [Williamsia sp. CHRR-6]